MMTEETSFIDQLIAEAENKEHELLYAHYDMITMEINRIQKEIEATFQQAEIEKKLIDEWVLAHNVKRQEPTEYLTTKIEAFMRDEAKKTLDLPHAVLKLHKRSNKAEVTDMDAFLANESADIVTVVPESIKQSLTGTKKIIKMSGGKIPQGVNVIPGKDELTISFKQKNGGLNDTETEAGNPIEPANQSRTAL